MRLRARGGAGADDRTRRRGSGLVERMKKARNKTAYTLRYRFLEVLVQRRSSDLKYLFEMNYPLKTVPGRLISIKGNVEVARRGVRVQCKSCYRPISRSLRSEFGWISSCSLVDPFITPAEHSRSAVIFDLIYSRPRCERQLPRAPASGCRRAPAPYILTCRCSISAIARILLPRHSNGCEPRWGGRSRWTDPALFRFALIRISEDQTLWFQKTHHLIIDSFGRHLLHARTAARYRALRFGEPLAPLDAATPEEILDRERRYAASSAYEVDRAYWLERLAHWPGPLLDVNRENTERNKSGRAARIAFTLKRADFDRLETAARNLGSSVVPRDHCPDLRCLLASVRSL